MNPDDDPRGLWKSGDLSVGPAIESNIYEIRTPSGRLVSPPSGYSWRLSSDRLQEFIADNRIWFGADGNSVPSIKRFLSEVKRGITPMTIWKYSDVGHSQEATQEVKNLFDGAAYFTYPKPVRLIKSLLSLLPSNDGIVVDFFAGSGTTAHAVMQLNAEDGGNRKCISVQLPEPTPEKSPAREANLETIADISRERIRRAGKKILKDETAKLDARAETLDVGFRAYKLADTNFAKWKINATIDENELENLFDSVRDSANDASSPEELFTETILKLGLSLTEQYEQKELAGLTVFSVDHDLILGYFDEKIKPSLDQLRELVELAEVRLIVLEDAFQGDDELKTNLVQLCKTRGIDLSIA